MLGGDMVIRLKGKWKEGYAIDMHIISSNYVGDNQHGHPIYYTKRTQMGELIYQLKYQGKQNIDDIMDLVKPVLDKWKIKEKVDIVIPIPPSDSRRSVQPVFLIAKEIAKYLDIPISSKVLKKTRSEQLKDIDIDRKSDSIKTQLSKKRILKDVLRYY